MNKPKGYYEWTNGSGGYWKHGGIYYYDGSYVTTEEVTTKKMLGMESPSWRYIGPENPQEEKKIPLCVYICEGCKEGPEDPCYLVIKSGYIKGVVRKAPEKCPYGYQTCSWRLRDGEE